MYIYIYSRCIYEYIIYWFETIVLKPWTSTTVFFNYTFYFLLGQYRVVVIQSFRRIELRLAERCWVTVWAPQSGASHRRALQLVIFIIKKYWWWRPSLRNYSLRQINNIYIHIYMCVYLFAPSRGQPLCFSLWINNSATLGKIKTFKSIGFN